VLLCCGTTDDLLCLLVAIIFLKDDRMETKEGRMGKTTKKTQIEGENEYKKILNFIDFRRQIDF
jgi:hypothetical protein